MKPRYLKVEAFGPFADAQHLYFDRLGDQALFLIHGVTGAGKSAILDALCFALYGETAGKEREAAQMRCQFSPANVLTRVELVFTLGDKTYRIERFPTQERPKARGEGTTTQQTKAHLWSLQNINAEAFDTLDVVDASETTLLAKSALETTRAVEALTGLNAEQFRQIMVLPQGKFREFLMANSNDREKIFSRLFQTQFYSRIESELKQQASDIRQKLQGQIDQKAGLLSALEVNDENELNEKINKLQPELALSKKNLEEKEAARRAAQAALAAAQAIEQQFVQLEKIEAELGQVQAQQTSVDEVAARLSKARSADRVANVFERMQEANDQLDEIGKRIEATHESLSQAQADVARKRTTKDAAEKRQQALPGLYRKQSLWQSLQPKVEKFHQLTAQLEQKKAQLQQQEKREKELTQQKIQSAEAIDSIEGEIQKKDDAIRSAERAQTYLLEAKRLHGDAVRIAKLQSTQEQLESEIEERSKQLEQQKVQCEKQTLKTKSLEKDWHLGHAARLAQELRDNTACPVCGSEDHPHPASEHLNQSLVSDAELEAQRQALADAERSYSECLHAMEVARVKQADLTDQYQQAWQLFLTQAQAFHHDMPIHSWPWDSLDQSQAALEKTVSMLNTQVTGLPQLRSEYASSKDQKTELQRRHREQTEALERLLQEFQSDKKMALTLETQVGDLGLELDQELRETQPLEARLKNLDAEIRGLISEWEQAQQAEAEASVQYAKLQSGAQELQEQRAVAEEKAREALQNWDSVLSGSIFADIQAFDAARSSVETQEHWQTQVTQHEQRILRLHSQKEQLLEQLGQATRPALEQLDKQLAQCTADADDALQQWQVLDRQRQNIEEVSQKLRKLKKKNAALDEAYALVGTLSDVANGNSATKISLQRFVLSVLLDEVLEEASHRLQQLSAGRYTLVRKFEKNKGARASGLDLEVQDFHTGAQRAVATLSGGESFMAALALALGLSDTVQAYAGGIRLDMLFVDEGFGSLDRDALDRAIEVLMELQDSGRTIGVISHVSELKEQINLRVEVRRSAKGSEIMM